MTKTQEDVIERALQEIGVLAAGQSAEAEDVAVALKTYGPLLDMLTHRSLYTVGDPDVIEDEAFLPLAILLGQWMAPAFGKPKDLTAIAMAEGMLIEISDETVSEDPVPAVYF